MSIDGEKRKKSSQRKITMTLIQSVCPNHIALPMGKQGACFAEGGDLAPMFEKLATELKPERKLPWCKNIVHIVTFNVTTLNRLNQLPDLPVSVAGHNIIIKYIQEHRYYHSELEIKYHYTGNGWTLVSVSAFLPRQCRHKMVRNASQSSWLKITK